jgi:hypothetical protein
VAEASFLPRAATLDYRSMQILVRQGRLVLQAGELLSDWAAGADAASTRARLAAGLAEARSLQRQLEALSAPSSARSLLAAARALAGQRTAQIEACMAFLEAGRPEQSRLRSFQSHWSQRGLTPLLAWLYARRALAATMAASPHPGRLRTFYTWSRDALLPAQVEQARLSTEAVLLVGRLAETPEEAPSLEKKAGLLVARARAVTAALERGSVPAWLALARSAFLEESRSLEASCQAVQQLLADPGEDAGARVRYRAREQQKRSRVAEDRLLEALARALEN